MGYAMSAAFKDSLKVFGFFLFLFAVYIWAEVKERKALNEWAKQPGNVRMYDASSLKK